MFARVSTFEGGSPEQIEAGLALVRRRVLPELREIPGYCGVISLVDQPTGKGITISFWESPEAMRRSESEGDRLRAQIASLEGQRVGTVERFEVKALELKSHVMLDA